MGVCIPMGVHVCVPMSVWGVCTMDVSIPEGYVYHGCVYTLGVCALTVCVLMGVCVYLWVSVCGSMGVCMYTAGVCIPMGTCAYPWVSVYECVHLWERM